MECDCSIFNGIGVESCTHLPERYAKRRLELDNDARIAPYSLRDYKNVDIIEISGHIDVIAKEAFSNLIGSNKSFSKISFMDATIKKLDSRSLSAVENFHAVEFIRCAIGTIDSNALGLENIARVSFTDCTIGEIRPQAFAGVRQVGKLLFKNCEIEIASNYIARNAGPIDVIELSGTSIKDCMGENMLSDIRDVKQVQFGHKNVFLVHIDTEVGKTGYDPNASLKCSNGWTLSGMMTLCTQIHA